MVLFQKRQESVTALVSLAPRIMGAGCPQREAELLFPMKRSDRATLLSIATNLENLEHRASRSGLDYLALLISHALEEASERLNEDALARTERHEEHKSTAAGEEVTAKP